MSQTINCHPFCVFWNRECYQMLPNVLEVTPLKTLKVQTKGSEVGAHGN